MLTPDDGFKKDFIFALQVQLMTAHTISTKFSPDATAEDIIARNCNQKPITNHPFFQRISQEPPNLYAYWTYFANFEPLTVNVPDWFASLLLRVDYIKLKSLLAAIIYDELGRGDLTKIHATLMTKLVRGLSPWAIKSTAFDSLAPGKNIGREFDKLYFGEMNDDFFVLGSIVAGELYGGQMAFFMTDEVRRQNCVAPGIFEWLFVHEEIEADHANVSRVMAEILPTSGVNFESIMAGSQWKQNKFWQWLDGIYQVAYGEKPFEKK